MNFFCVKEHVTSSIYECHLPSERPMIITFRDERGPEKPAVEAIGVILGPGVRQFISPNDLHIQYYGWTCVNRSHPIVTKWVLSSMVCRLLGESKGKGHRAFATWPLFMPATTYSPTHFRVQYNRPSGA